MVTRISIKNPILQTFSAGEIQEKIIAILTNTDDTKEKTNFDKKTLTWLQGLGRLKQQKQHEINYTHQNKGYRMVFASICEHACSAIEQ